MRETYLADHQRLLREGEGIFAPGELEQAVEHGLFGIGAAHGNAGMAAALGAAASTAGAPPAASELAAAAVRWVGAQQTTQGHSSFPEVAGTLLSQRQSGWCNGDIGVAVALLVAANGLGDGGVRAWALDLARREARRRGDDIEAANRHNPMLCHGHAGRAI